MSLYSQYKWLSNYLGNNFRCESWQQSYLFICLLFGWRPFASRLADLHFSFHFQLFSFFLPLVFLDLLSCEFVYIACWQSIFADCPQEHLICLKQTCILDQVVISFNSLYWFGFLVHFVNNRLVINDLPLLFYFQTLSLSLWRLAGSFPFVYLGKLPPFSYFLGFYYYLLLSNLDIDLLFASFLSPFCSFTYLLSFASFWSLLSFLSGAFESFFPSFPSFGSGTLVSFFASLASAFQFFASLGFSFLSPFLLSPFISYFSAPLATVFYIEPLPSRLGSSFPAFCPFSGSQLRQIIRFLSQTLGYYFFGSGLGSTFGSTFFGGIRHWLQQVINVQNRYNNETKQDRSSFLTFFDRQDNNSYQCKQDKNEQANHTLIALECFGKVNNILLCLFQSRVSIFHFVPHAVQLLDLSSQHQICLVDKLKPSLIYLIHFCNSQLRVVLCLISLPKQLLHCVFPFLLIRLDDVSFGWAESRIPSFLLLTVVFQLLVLFLKTFDGAYILHGL